MRNQLFGRFPAVEPDEWGPGYRLLQRARVFLQQRGPAGSNSLTRLASHGVIVLMVLLVLLGSRLRLPDWEIASAPGAGASANLANVTAQSGSLAPALGSLVRAAVPRTVNAQPPQDQSPQPPAGQPAAAAPANDPKQQGIVEYTVQPGDTLYGIADKYHISAETIMWANSMETNPDLLRLGQQLTIPPVSGVLHTVAQGDTVESVAKKYKANAADIVGLPANKLDPANPALQAGQTLIVPGGSKPTTILQAQAAQAPAQSAGAPRGAPVGAGRFVWPTRGTITQGYLPLHHALDIATNTGTPVHAADSGYVATAGWSNAGYGNYIIINHGNGFQTLYGHLSKISVVAGQTVGQGDLIGLVGSTGNSTGPHLHFEIRLNGVTQNPYSYLP